MEVELLHIEQDSRIKSPAGWVLKPHAAAQVGFLHLQGRVQD